MDQTCNVLIGVTGCINVMHIVDLVNELERRKLAPSSSKAAKNSKINMRLIVTKSANHFLTYTIKEELGNLGVEIFNDEREWKTWSQLGDPILHIQLRLWADVFILAPLSANSLAKLASGICDDLLTCVARAWDLKKPLLFYAAMHPLMLEHPLTDEHIKKLISFGYIKIEENIDKPKTSLTLPTTEIVEKVFATMGFKDDPDISIVDSVPPAYNDKPAGRIVHLPSGHKGGVSLLRKPSLITRYTRTRSQLEQASRAKLESAQDKTEVSNSQDDPLSQAEVFLESDRSRSTEITQSPQSDSDSIGNARKRRRKTDPKGESSGDNLPPIISRAVAKLSNNSLDTAKDLLMNGVNKETKIGENSCHRSLTGHDNNKDHSEDILDDSDFDPVILLEQTMTTDDPTSDKESCHSPNDMTKNDNPYMPILDTNRFLALCFDQESKSYKCTICKHDYKNRKSCLRHLKEQHIGSSSFQCRICGISFKRRDQLQKHEDDKHTIRLAPASLSASDCDSEGSNRVEIQIS